MKTWDDYDYDESDDEEFKKLSPLGIDPPVSLHYTAPWLVCPYLYGLALLS